MPPSCPSRDWYTELVTAGRDREQNFQDAEDEAVAMANDEGFARDSDEWFRYWAVAYEFLIEQ